MPAVVVVDTMIDVEGNNDRCGDVLLRRFVVVVSVDVIDIVIVPAGIESVKNRYFFNSTEHKARYSYI